jgi:LL-diaminopimelate aminotransferase
MRIARRVESLPPYLFAELDRKIAERRASGVDVISLGIGDPDTPTPRHIVEALQEAAEDPATHRYPSYYGMPAFREAIASWNRERFGVELNPETEVQPLIGSKEGIAHLPVAMVDHGDEVLVPDPGYPVFAIGALLAGGTPVPMPLTAEKGFLPDLSTVRPSAATKLMWLNYPSNPTGAVAELEFFERAVAFAREHEVLLAHDAAYSQLTFDGFTAPSVLQVPGAMEVAVEFGSVSKTYNMTGWRVGWVAGNRDAVRALATVKTNIDSGIFNAVQEAAIAALTGPQDMVEELRAVYQKRRDLVVGTLNSLGWDLEPPRGSIYIWLPTPPGTTSTEFCELLLDRAGVVLAPGVGYGAAGEGYARISLTVPDDSLAEAMDRLRRALA